MSTRLRPQPLLRALFSGRDTDGSARQRLAQAVLEHMPMAALLAAQRSGTILGLNGKAAALTGWSREELLRLLVAEVVAAPEAGRIVAHRTPGAIAAAVRSLFAAPPARAATRAYAEKFSWDDTTNGLIELFSGLLPQPR